MLVARSLLFLVFSQVSAYAVDTLPQKPVQGISDSAQVLSLSLSKTLERLLAEHQSLTHESILILTLKKSPGDESLDSYAVRVFDSWKALTPKPTSVVVLIFDTEKHHFSSKAGVGLDSLLSDRGGDVLGSSVAVPELKHDRSDRAVLLTTRKVFELLESPVFLDGKFDSELRDSGFYETFTPVVHSKQDWGWWIWLLFAGLIAGGLGYRILTVEVHYTAAGWHRVSGWENLLRYLKRIFFKTKKNTPKLMTGGGVSGSY